MMGSWRRLMLAAALNVTVGVGVAAAQTVIVRHAAPGSTVELMLNSATIRSGQANSRGDARLIINLSVVAGKAEIDVQVAVDACEGRHRVLLAEPGLTFPPVEESCTRGDIAGLFVMRRVTTFVVDVAGASPTLWLRQGPAPMQWLSDEPIAVRSERTWDPSHTGLVLFGGGSFARVRSAMALACGDVTECSGDGSRYAYSAGASFWVLPYAGAEIAYLKPTRLDAAGGGDTYRFTSFFDAKLVTITGKGGIPFGRFRIYGKGGVNFHRATFGTTQTIDDTTITVDDVETTLKGGTQEFALRTKGWGWIYGGGMEIWLAPTFAIYTEITHATIKGKTIDKGEGQVDDRLIHIMVGATIRIGR